MAEIDPATLIRLHRPKADSICDPADNPTPQERGAEAVLISAESGPCGGVEMAEVILDRLIERFGRTRLGEPVRATELFAHDAPGVELSIPIYANHPPSKGVERKNLYEKAGVIFTDDIDSAPEGSVYLFSAHGADPREVRRASDRGLHVVDTTCPLVGHVYKGIDNMMRRAGEDEQTGVVYVAPRYTPNHPEVRGTRGVAEDKGAVFIPIENAEEAVALAEGGTVGPEQLSLAGLQRVHVTGLTTNNAREVQAIAEDFEQRIARRRLPMAVEPYKAGTVCRTVQYRQEAVHEMIDQGVESLVVVGALDSHNTNQLVTEALRAAEAAGTERKLADIYFANTYHDLPDIHGRVGVVSGASTQSHNVEQILMRLAPTAVERVGAASRIDMFKPMGGRDALATRILAGDFSWADNG